MRAALRWFFEDRETGRIVVAQMPNVAMWIVLAMLALSFIVPHGRASTATDIVLVVALACWALDEVTRGVNPWRRALGIATLAGMALWLVALRG